MSKVSPTMSNFNTPSHLLLKGNLKENWKKFIRNFNVYMTASALEKEPSERQVAILLNFVGEEAMDVFNTFVFETPEDSKDIKKVVAAFQDYCFPKKNILHARFLFYERKQAEGENFDQFLTDVKTLLKDCEFISSDELLRDKIVLHTTDKDVQDRLIKQGTVEVKDAIEAFRLAEVRRAQTKEIHSKQVNVVDTAWRTRRKEDSGLARNFNHNNRGNDVNNLSNDFLKFNRSVSGPHSYQHQHSQTTTRKCNRCGGGHNIRSHCPAQGRLCYRCEKIDRDLKTSKKVLTDMQTVKVTKPEKAPHPVLQMKKKQNTPTADLTKEVIPSDNDEIKTTPISPTNNTIKNSTKEALTTNQWSYQSGQTNEKLEVTTKYPWEVPAKSIKNEKYPRNFAYHRVTGNPAYHPNMNNNPKAYIAVSVIQQKPMDERHPDDELLLENELRELKPWTHNQNLKNMASIRSRWVIQSEKEKQQQPYSP